MIIALCTFISACATSPDQKKVLLISEQVPLNESIPKIKKLTDLGYSSLSLGAPLPKKRSDKRFSPGEWVMVKGNNLGAEHVTIDGIAPQKVLYYGDSLLFKVPAGLSPLKTHRLKIDNAFGSATVEFETSHYIVSTDTDGDKVYLIRTNLEERGGVEEDWLEIDQETPMFNLINSAGDTLYSFNVVERVKRRLEKENAYRFAVNAFDLVAPDQPQASHNIELIMDSAPTDVLINNENIAAVLGRQSLMLLDLNRSEAMSEISRLELPRNSEEDTIYTDAAFFNSNKMLAVIETTQNQLVLIDISNPQTPKVIKKEKLLTDKSIPLLVDVVSDPNVENKIWLLVSPNFRSAGSKIVETYKAIVKDQKRRPEKKAMYAMLPVTVDDAFNISPGDSLALPEKYAFYFSVFGTDGRIYISSSKMDLLNIKTEKKGRNLLGRVSDFLKDTFFFGRIIALDINTGEVEQVSSGAGVFFHLVDVPDIGPVFSIIKFGPSFSFPYLSPHWGMGIKSTGTYTKRKMNKWVVVPPYSAGHVSFQY